LDGLTLGVGSQILANLAGSGAQLTLNTFSREVHFREVESFLQASAAPTAGLFMDAIPGWRFGLSYRSEIRVDYGIPANIEIESLANMKFVVNGVRFFMPHTFELGATWDATSSLSLSLSGQYALWSRQPNQYLRVNLDLSGDTLQALGLSDVLDLSSPGINPGFANTLSVRAGAQWKASEAWTFRMGAAYRPTPVPQQNTAGTNWMDASNIGLGLGAQWNVRDPADFFESPFQFDLGAQFVYLLPRSALKDPVDPVPSYSFRGIGGGASLQVSYAFQ
jgi:long-subunit fatty acid transport protein